MSKLIHALARQPRLPRFLCHLYQRLQQDRLNLVTGAGISIEAGVPPWHGLLERLTEHSVGLKADLLTHKTTGLSPEYLGQIIYHRYRSTCPDETSFDLKEATINNGWAESIHNAIYSNVPDDIDTVIKSHPYLGSLRDLARKLPLVINFNFDDILADAIGKQIETTRSGRPFTVVWQPPLLDRRDYTTIYHVNGVLPKVSLKKRSPHLTFTEDSFADALARSPGVSAEYIFLRFVQNTMLIIGHSLSDSSLKNYLRRNRDKSPANHHYMIYWIKDHEHLTDTQRSDVFEANLELYNVITIFLTSFEIKEFLDILNLSSRDFRDVIESLGDDRRSRYHYYIVGPVASGKSTLLEHLRCFNTQEEWTRPPPREMYLAFNQLNDEQSKRVDKFIYEELKEKNIRMHDAGVGFHFMDRGPLDLYAFSKDDAEQKRKTSELKKHVIPDKPLHQGEIIFIWAEGTTLVKRNLGRGRPSDKAGESDYLANQTSSLRAVYNPTLSLQTDNLAAGDIAKQVARHVLFDDYLPKNLEEIMNAKA